jgi:hypothetical protein
VARRDDGIGGAAELARRVLVAADEHDQGTVLRYLA